MNQIILSLKNRNLDPESLAFYSKEFIEVYLSETPIQAEFQKTNFDFSQKGDGISFANIVLTFISTGSAIALFEVFKTYLSKDSSMEFELKNEAGETIKFNVNNLSKDQFDKALKIINKKTK